MSWKSSLMFAVVLLIALLVVIAIGLNLGSSASGQYTIFMPIVFDDYQPQPDCDLGCQGSPPVIGTAPVTPIGYSPIPTP